jgi:hypothetical protein
MNVLARFKIPCYLQIPAVAGATKPPDHTHMTTIKNQADALTPVVHLNGTSKKALAQTWEQFHAALRDLRLPEVNGRDYYVKDEFGHGLDSASKQIAEWREQLRRIEAVTERVRLSIDAS